MRSNHNIPYFLKLGIPSSISLLSRKGITLGTADLHIMRGMVLDLPQQAHRHEYQTLA